MTDTTTTLPPARPVPAAAWGRLLGAEARMVARDTAGLVIPVALPVLLLLVNGLGREVDVGEQRLGEPRHRVADAEVGEAVLARVVVVDAGEEVAHLAGEDVDLDGGHALRAEGHALAARGEARRRPQELR